MTDTVKWDNRHAGWKTALSSEIAIHSREKSLAKAVSTRITSLVTRPSRTNASVYKDDGLFGNLHRSEPTYSTSQREILKVEIAKAADELLEKKREKWRTAEKPEELSDFAFLALLSEKRS